MSRINLFSTILVDKYGLKQHEADEFVEAMFAVIREKLEEEKLVKVKGLGTFKLAEMNSRESVDVNTGERITIEGRYKLSFTPENAVRDRINAPFAQFESIDIDEDIDFSAIDKKYESAPEPEEESHVEEAPAVVAPVISAPVEEVHEEEKPIVEEPVEETPQEEQHVEETPATETTTEESAPAEETPTEEPAEEPVPTEETAEEESTEVAEDNAVEAEEPVAEEPVAEKEEPVEEKSTDKLETVRSPFCENLIREEIEHSHRIIKLLKIVICLVVILLLAAGAYFGYHMWKNSQQNAPKTEQKAVQQPAPATPSATVDQSVNPTEPAEKPADETAPKTEEVKDTPAETPAETTVSDDSIYNKDARVRTGAYRIVGLNTTVTVLKGQTLKSISKAYLGEGMECYVEVFNGGIKTVSAGDKIKIPKVELKKKHKK